MDKIWPHRHGAFPQEFPQGVLYSALKCHGWKQSQADDGTWYRRVKGMGGLKERTEFWNRADAWPFYPRTQRKIWKEIKRRQKNG